MSGELQVVFIYDTQRCKREEDDPKDAILYFHPEEIPEPRRIAICGQLMGITQFLVSVFSAPKILTLQNGKFALKDFGRQYILALGCSSVTPDWLLEKQAGILHQLTKFFHKDIDHLLSTVGDDRAALSRKLGTIMDHYIPISQHHGDLFALTFGILPILNLPKSASHVSLSATLVLQNCVLKEGVLGGVVMFQNKVIAVELMQEVARRLAFIQPYQLPPADPAKTGFSIPPGVQLLKVYVNQNELEEMRKHAKSFQDPATAESGAKNRGSLSGKISSIREDPHEAKPISSSSSIEVSRHKEDVGVENLNSLSRQVQLESPAASYFHVVNCGSSLLTGKRLFQSLSNFPVSSKTATGQEEEEDEELLVKPDLKTYSSSITDPLYPFLRCDGKNFSKFYLDASMDNYSSQENEKEDEEDHHDVAKFSKGKIKEESKTCKLKPTKAKTKFHSSGSGSGSEGEKGGFKLTLEKLNPKDKDKSEKENQVPKMVEEKVQGPSRPKELLLNSTSNSRMKTRRRWSTFEDMMSPVLENPVAGSGPVPLEVESPSKVRDKKSASIGGAETGYLSKPYKTTLLNSFKKLSTSPEEHSDSGRGSTGSKHGSDSFPPSTVNSSMMDNKYIQSPDHAFPPWSTFAKSKKSICSDPSVYEDVVLFIYSLGGMRLLLLLEKEALSRELIQSLRDYGSTSMSELELAVSSVEEQSMSMTAGHHDHYCYLHYEPVWQSLAHGGRNHNMDFEVVQHMHQDFHVHPNINELIIRGDDHVIYGYQCVGSEVFYQQSAGPQPGLPMPSDLMGKVPLKAKRRLERDHNILLL